MIDVSAIGPDVKAGRARSNGIGIFRAGVASAASRASISNPPFGETASAPNLTATEEAAVRAVGDATDSGSVAST